MNLYFFIFILFSLQFFYWYVGKKSTKSDDSEKDYFLGGKQVKLFPLAMTFLATQVGGGIILGSAEEAYISGPSVIFFPLGSVLGLILLGLGIGKKLALLPVSTVAEIFELVYKSTKLKKVASLLSIISLYMILISQFIASSKFLVSLGVESPYLFVAFWAIVILYTSQGGLKAVISTDIVQATFFSFAFAGCFFYVASNYNPSLALSESSAFLAPELSSKISSWILMPLMFMLIEQDMAQRCFAGNSPKTVSKASIIAGIGTLLMALVPIFLGCLARSLNIDIPQGGSVLMTIVAKLTNPTFTAIIGAAILAAIISTATSLINAISSNLGNDFKLSYLTESKRLKFIKWATIAFSLSGIAIAFKFNNIVSLLIQSYELSVSCLFVSILFALYKEKKSLFAAWLSIITGASCFFLLQFFPIPFPKEMISVLGSFVSFLIGERLEIYYNKRYNLIQTKN